MRVAYILILVVLLSSIALLSAPAQANIAFKCTFPIQIGCYDTYIYSDEESFRVYLHLIGALPDDQLLHNITLTDNLNNDYGEGNCYFVPDEPVTLNPDPNNLTLIVIENCKLGDNYHEKHRYDLNLFYTVNNSDPIEISGEIYYPKPVDTWWCEGYEEFVSERPDYCNSLLAKERAVGSLVVAFMLSTLLLTPGYISFLWVRKRSIRVHKRSVIFVLIIQIILFIASFVYPGYFIL